VENLSLLSYRKIFQESLLPNTINYLVVIDSARGIFLGEVFQTKVASSEKLHDSINYGKLETVFPEISIDIIGIMTYHDKKFRLPEFMTVGVSEKVYLANKVVVQKYLESIETTSSSEVQLQPFATYLDMDEAEVSLKPSTFSDEEVKKLNLGIDTTISPGKISMQQWSMLFETNSNTQSAVLAEAIHSLRYQQKNGQTSCLVKAGQNIAQLQQELASVSKIDIDFNISLLPEQIAAESVSEPNRGSDYVYDTFKANANSYLIQKVTYQLSNTNFLKFFNYDPQLLNLLDEIESFIHTPNISLYINTSTLGASEGIGGMIIDLICNYIISQSGIIPFVFFIDEVHRYTKSQYSEEEFHKGLTLVAREGRKKGIFLFLTSQNPQDVSPVLLGQIGTLLIHRLTHNDEIRAIKNHLDDYSIKQVKKLNQGESILTSINLMQNIFLHVIKCNRKQDNDTPTL
jgi:hypothetical protein